MTPGDLSSRRNQESLSSRQSGLHDLDPLDAGQRSSQKHQTLPVIGNGALFWAGLYGLLITLASSILWTVSRMTTLDAKGRSDMTNIPTRDFASDEKYLLMDYSPWLGFNNMRYMIERGLYLADMLNRTLVLPTHMRIRQCSDEVICARTATPLNLKAIGRNDQRSTIALNLGYFFDLPHLSMKMHGNVIDFKVFMEQVVGVPKGAALVDSQFGAQTSFWLNNMQRWQHEQGQPGPRPNTEIVYRAVDDSEEIGFNGDISEQGPKFQDIQLETHGTSIRRVRREKWDLVDQDELSVIDNLVRNGLVDSVEAAKASDRIYTNTDGESSFKVRRSFYAFADVRGGGLDRIVEWSLNFKYTPEDINQIMHKGKPLLGKDSCRPPKEGPQVNKIPWEARFPAFATCRIENYVGIKQELDDFHEQIISIEGQFHTTGWIPIIYSSLENANKYRTIATTFLQYAPAVHEAADYLMKRLKDMVLARHSQHLTSSNNPHEGKPDSSWLLLSMHVRRGDFITDKYGWQEFSDTWMKSLVKNAVDTVFSPEPSISSRLPPNIGFYMATDESSPWVIDYFHSLGAILFEDLTDGPFEKRFAQLIVYDDWIGLVEQLICAKAKRFYGTMTSSFTSGIVNMRLGMDQSQDDGPSQTNFEYLIKEGGPVLTDAQEEFGM